MAVLLQQLFECLCTSNHEFGNEVTFITFIYINIMSHLPPVHDVLQGRPPGPQREGSSDLPDSLSPSLLTVLTS